MCGLIGMIGNAYEQDKKALKNLLQFDVVRGGDSTGLAVVDKNDGKIKVMKKKGGPDHLLETASFNKGVYNGPAGKVFIGHNRAATKGAVTDENAHPFHHNSVVGAHNGTLVSTYMLENGDKFDVDSEAIFYNLDKFDIESVIPNIWGAYALTWYDAIEERFFVIRNKERPLYWTRRTDKDVIFWASEAWMLRIALARNNIAHGEIEEFKEDTLYSFDLSNKSENYVHVPMRDRDWEDEGILKGYVPKKQTRSNYHYSGSQNNGGSESNVVPFVGAPSSNKSNIFSGSGTNRADQRDEAMKKLANTIVKFRVSEVKLGLSKTPYLSCFPDNPAEDWDIRIFGKGHKDWESWKEGRLDKVYEGHIKRFVKNFINGKKEAYLLVDLRSIKEVDPTHTNYPKEEDDEVEGRFFTGYMGAYLTHDEWKKATSCGCALCSSPAQADDDDMMFVSETEYFCGNCIDTEFAQNWMQLANVI